MNSESLVQNLNTLFDLCGPPMEKTAEVQYLYDLEREEWESGALTPKFVKLAYGIGKEPWDLAYEVASNFDGLQKMAGSNELAEFYVNWADEIEKNAGIALLKGLGSLGIGRGLKAGAGILKKRLGTYAQRLGVKPGVATGTSQWQLGGVPKVVSGKSKWVMGKGGRKINPLNVAIGASVPIGLGAYMLGSQPTPQPGYGY